MSITLPMHSQSLLDYYGFLCERLKSLTRALLLLILIVFWFATRINAQSCNCPSQTDCNPCGGGISRLTLKYVGNNPSVVFIRDNSETVFWETVRPGEVFTIQGESNDKFSGNQIYIFVNGSPHAEIKVNCSLEFDPSTRYGSFTIVSARSKEGGNMCCTSNVADVTAPVITECPTDIDMQLTSACTALVTWKTPKVSDCNLKTFTSNQSSGTQFPVGTTQVTYTATDVNNNSATCSFNVTVRDRIAPVVSKCPAQVIVKAGNTCKGKASWIPPTFTDNCSAVSVTSSHAPGSEFAIGTTEVTYTARDAAGNQAQCKFNIVVQDALAPVVVTKPADIVISAQSSCKATASWVPPTFTDCSAVTITSSHKPGDEFATGTTSVLYTAKDADGNASTYTFKITVNDVDPPVIADCPADIIIAASDPNGQVATWQPPVITDNCADPEIKLSHTPGMQFPLGTTQVTYIATDKFGNAATCSFTVVVQLSEAALTIPQIITPDGNGENDEWYIENIDKYEANKVVVVDRWGSVIYSAQNYNNDRTVWRGTDASGRVLPTGTYFFTVSVSSGGAWIDKSGFIELIQ